MTAIDESIYRLTVEQRNATWREVEFWQQRYNQLLEAVAKGEHLRTSQPVMLAEKESFEAGRVMEREACAQICAQRAKDFQDLFEKYGYEHDDGARVGALRCEGLIRARGKQ